MEREGISRARLAYAFSVGQFCGDVGPGCHLRPRYSAVPLLSISLCLGRLPSQILFAGLPATPPETQCTEAGKRGAASSRARPNHSANCCRAGPESAYRQGLARPEGEAVTCLTHEITRRHGPLT